MTIDSNSLDYWIQPQHLSAEASSRYRAAFQTHAAGVLHIPNFLNDEVAHNIAQFLTQTNGFRPMYGIFSESAHFSEMERWLAIPEEDRLFAFEVLGKLPDTEKEDPHYKLYRRLRNRWRKPFLYDYIGALTGIPLESLQFNNVVRMMPGHMIKPHSDKTGGDRLTLLLYLTPGWQTDYGGDLTVIDQQGDVTTYPPLFNSCLIFDIHKHKQHAVLEIKPGGGQHGRLSLAARLRQVEEIPVE